MGIIPNLIRLQRSDFIPLHMQEITQWYHKGIAHYRIRIGGRYTLYSIALCSARICKNKQSQQVLLLQFDSSLKEKRREEKRREEKRREEKRREEKNCNLQRNADTLQKINPRREDRTRCAVDRTMQSCIFPVRPAFWGPQCKSRSFLMNIKKGPHCSGL